MSRSSWHVDKRSVTEKLGYASYVSVFAPRFFHSPLTRARRTSRRTTTDFSAFGWRLRGIRWGTTVTKETTHPLHPAKQERAALGQLVSVYQHPIMELRKGANVHFCKQFIAVAVTIFISASVYAAPITGQISFEGYAESPNSTGMGTAAGIDFANGSGYTVSGTSGGIYSYGAGSGSFAAFSGSSSSGTAGTIMDIANFSTEPATNSEVTFNTQGGPTISFDLTSIEQVSDNSGDNSLTFTAIGTTNFLGYDPTPATLIFTAQANNIVSFSATLLATTPEPASLTLLSAASMLLTLRRRRV